MAANGQDEYRSDHVRTGAGETDIYHAAQLRDIHYFVIGRPMDRHRAGIRQGSRCRVQRSVVLSHEETRHGVEEDRERASEQIVVGQVSRRFHIIADVLLLGHV